VLALVLAAGAGCSQIEADAPPGATNEGGHGGGGVADASAESDASDGAPFFDTGNGDETEDDAPADVTFSDVDGAGLQDALPDVTGDACSDAGSQPGPIVHTCAAPTDDECDGKTDPSPNPALANGKYGNAFDDDCDGLVDEGCACGPQHAPGTTRPCWLVPSTQVDPNTSAPVGWCAQNSVGTVACVAKGGGEFKDGFWDGFCKGAQPPFADDVCPAGDFDCDGLDSNSASQDCTCAPKPVVACPVDPLVVSPYPNPHDLTQKKQNPLDPNPSAPFVIDGDAWIVNGQAAQATSWTWTVTGGDCDNILPHPTFAVYDGPDTATAARIGTMQPGLGQNGQQHGFVVGGPSSSQHQIWPAFSLSGDYLVEGSFELDGQTYTCTQKVQVRWPGLRAELCWDTVGAQPAHDLDLHLARLQNPATCQAGHAHGWMVSSCGPTTSATAGTPGSPGTPGTGGQSDDCYYSCASGCRTNNQSFCANQGQAAPPPGWGYVPSAADACHGWGSFRGGVQTCDNPRLDRDNLGCDPTVEDPNAACNEVTGANCFCGPENINLDDPADGDRFLVGVHYYNGSNAHPHVNIYCNGERKLAFGYDPTTTPQTLFPNLKTGYGGGSVPTGGDMWVVARVLWDSTQAEPCTIEPVPSHTPKMDKDGSPNACVDTGPANTGTGASGWPFTSSVAQPPPVADYCWH
jgi:hypothetical protein